MINPQARFVDVSATAIRRLAATVVMPLVEASTRITRDSIVGTIDPGPARTGRIYYKPGTKTPYTSSAPGQPPAIREALTRDSFQTDAPVIQGQTVIGYVFSDRVVESASGRRWLLAWLLDQGTDKMKARPYIDAGIKTAEQEIRHLVRQARGLA